MLYPRYHLHLAARYVAKFHKATLFGSKFLAANTLHFKPIFDFPLKKSCKEGPRPRWGCANKSWSFFSASKNLGAQHPLGAKVVQRAPVARGVVPQRSGDWCCVQRLLCLSKRHTMSSLTYP